MSLLFRRRTVLLGMAGTAFSGSAQSFPVAPVQAGLSAAASDRDFSVLRNGDPIGHHIIDIKERGGRKTVDIDILMEVGIGPLILYRYRHRNREIWQDGNFQSFESETDDDGQAYRVTAERRGGIINVTRDRGDDYETDDLSLLPTTYWNPETVERKRLINSQDGEIAEVQVRRGAWQLVETASGQVGARRFDVEGDLKLSIWYDRDGRWTKLFFPLKGDRFEYKLA